VRAVNGFAGQSGQFGLAGARAKFALYRSPGGQWGPTVRSDRGDSQDVGPGAVDVVALLRDHIPPSQALEAVEAIEAIEMFCRALAFNWVIYGRTRTRERAAAERDLEEAATSGIEVEAVFQKAAALMERGAAIYAFADDETRRQLNVPSSPGSGSTSTAKRSRLRVPGAKLTQLPGISGPWTPRRPYGPAVPRPRPLGRLCAQDKRRTPNALSRSGVRI
jgi:hypothetical protein